MRAGFAFGLLGALLWGASAASGQTVTGPCTLKGDLSADPPKPCADAIATAPDAKSKGTLLLRYAYSLNEQGRGIDALAILDKAVALSPLDADIRHERLYTLNDLGLCRRALADSDVEVTLKPDRAETYRERSFTHECLGDFAGAVADYSKQMDLDAVTPGKLMARARDLLWLGRYDDAEADIARAQMLSNGDPQVTLHAAMLRARSLRLRDVVGGKASPARCVMTGMDKHSAPKSLIADCTAAFLTAGTAMKKGEALATRSIAWRILDEDETSATEDLKVAAGIDPDNPNSHINYGFALLGVRHSWAARNEFDLALAKAPHWVALAGRGQASSNLGDKAGALRDAKASFEMKPNEAAAWLLGDLAFDSDDKATARGFWLTSYRLGERDDRLIEQLKSVGVADPAAELAKDSRRP